MSEQEQNSTVLNDLSEQVEDQQAEAPKEEVKEVKESQEELDWRSQIDEDLKKDNSLAKFKTVTDLAKSYKHLESKLGKKIPELNEDAKYDDFLKFSEETYKIKEDSYADLNEDLQAVALKHKLPPEQLKNYLKDASDVEKVNAEKESNRKQQMYKEQILNELPEDKFDVRFKAGLKALNMTAQEYKETLGVESLNPKLALKIAELGKNQYSEGVTLAKEGEPAGLPSDPDFLRDRIEVLSKEFMRAVSARDLRVQQDIQDELAVVKAKYNKVKELKRGNIL